jgi:5-formyltetrahydrofolate cyclo-ligase
LETVDLKRSIRSNTLKKRDAIPLPVRRVKDSAIKNNLFSLAKFKDAGRILLYASFRSEVDTLRIIQESLQMGKKVMLPKVKDDTLEIYEINSMEELAPGYMGIPEPSSSIERGINDVDMVIIPGAAFDTSGSRLGYGKGYYDRLLSGVKDKPLVALAYEEQIVENIPRETHDIGVDIIITDKRIIDCHGHRKN